VSVSVTDCIGKTFGKSKLTLEPKFFWGMPGGSSCSKYFKTVSKDLRIAIYLKRNLHPVYLCNALR
jgi:hypothetical protein